MPLKFPLRIRFFTHSLPGTHLSYNPSSSVPLIFRIFSSRLNHFEFGSRINFSTRPNRDQPEFERRIRDGGEIRAAKSLIEDEEELSNWVSGFRTGSSRGRLTSEDEDAVPNVEDRSRGRIQEKRGIRNQVDSFRDKRYGGDRERGFNSRIQGKSSQASFDGRKDTSFRRDRDKADYKGLRKREDILEDESSDEDVKSLVMGGIGDLLSEDDEEEDEDYEFLKKKAVSAFGFDKEKVTEADMARNANDSYLTKTRFDQYPLSPLSLKAIKDAGYETMTVVQEATLPIILKGKDVLAKAKTGTGKTVAFLLPSIEVVVKSPPTSPDNKRPPILALVICPTRELANQAATEANTLLKYHPSIGVQVVIGGTRLGLEQKRMQTNPCQILVATPGRLKDHIENTPGFATRLKGVKVLVLDEADHLLDMGFRKDIERIISAVLKERQTFLFSATVPEEVRQICLVALRRDHEFVNCVHEGTIETHQQVRQMHMIASLDRHFSLLYTLLREHIMDNVDYKVIVFCTTAMVTKLVADLLGELNLNVREIHSRKPQSYRTRVSNEFRKSKGLILVTSDVSARGVDYPDVTLVLQVGLPKDREQYIHRLGRTGRKGKEGEGILLLAPWEECFLSSLKDLPITKSPLPSIDPETVKKVQKALCHVEMRNKEAAYQAWLGYYNSQKMIGRDKDRLVELANEFSRSMGLDNPPAIPKLILDKIYTWMLTPGLDILKWIQIIYTRTIGASLSIVSLSLPKTPIKFLRRVCMAFAPILRRASAAKNLLSLTRLAVASSSLSTRSLQTGASGDDSQSTSGYHVSSGGFMRGAVYREPNKPLTIEEFHIPRPKANEILIKTKACGVCHSDLHVMKGEIPFASPCVIGHEITGEVVEHGPLTDHKIINRFPIGSRVVGAFIMPCGTCSYCAKGHDDLCEDFFAYNRAKGTLYDGETRLFLRHDDSPVYMYSMGGMAEYCVTPAHGLAPLPDSLPYTESAILGCAVFTAYGAMAHAAEIRPGDSIAVIGIGGVGSSCLQIARAFGASDIIAVDVQDDKLQKAKTLGATHIVNAAKEDAVDRIREITGGMGVDVAVEALGKPQTFMQCTLSVKDGGKAVMIGLSQAGSVGEIDINRLVRRKIKVIGSYGGRARQDLPKVVKLAESGIFNLTNAVSSKYKFEDAGKAFQDLNEGKIVSRGVVEIL